MKEQSMQLLGKILAAIAWVIVALVIMDKLGISQFSISQLADAILGR